MSDGEQVLPMFQGMSGSMSSAPLWRVGSAAISVGVVKRMFDIIASIMFILASLPTFMLIIVLLLCCGGSIFYVHQRVGAGGRPFRCLKFRTMVRNGDQVLATMLANDQFARIEWETKRKLVNDPRVTRIGRVLRKTSLDELPQLLNVLRGDMSLVGPRPIVPDEETKYGDDLSYYVAVRPGITGLWQVSGRSDTSFNERVALDRCYVENLSLRNDMLILLRTVLVLLNRSGAY